MHAGPRRKGGLHCIIADRIFEVLAQNCSGLALHTKEAEKTSPRWRDKSVLKADYGYEGGRFSQPREKEK